jgi:dTDP-4-dehydrorhamnose 3,5-epimerase
VQIDEFDSGGPVLVRDKIYRDERGLFAETFRAHKTPALKEQRNWVQDNMSRSTKAGTVRGLHWQALPMAQDKLVGVVKGAILDVVVDLRRKSATFGKAAGVRLSEEENQQLFVPVGFAHGFCTLVDDTIVTYKCSAYYDTATERSLAWHDRVLGIAWPVSVADGIVSAKDQSAPLLSQVNPQDFFDL